MARTPPATVAPALLVWARESIGLSVNDAAKKLGVKPDRLGVWEAGEAPPTVAQLRAMARAYKRPLAIFFLPEPPVDFRPLHDFRRLPGSVPAGWSSNLRLALRRALQQQQAAVELRLLLGDVASPRPVVHSSRTDAEVFASEARSLLGVALSDQLAWRDRYKAMTGWTAALERAGVLVLQTSGVSLDEMRGFSLDDPNVPVIALNGTDAPRGRIFTALHEWAHLLIERSGVCDLHDAGDRQDDEVERFCNEVAAAVLMPADALDEEPGVRLGRESGEVQNTTISELANGYSVSQEAVVRRLVSLGVVSWTFYLRKRAEYQSAYARRRADERGFAPYHRVRVRDLGKAYVRLVLEAYHDDRINVSEVSDYLGVRLKHLPDIEREALAG